MASSTTDGLDGVLSNATPTDCLKCTKPIATGDIIVYTGLGLCHMRDCTGRKSELPQTYAGGKGLGLTEANVKEVMKARKSEPIREEIATTLKDTVEYMERRIKEIFPVDPTPDLDQIIQQHRYEVEKLPPAVAFGNAKQSLERWAMERVVAEKYHLLIELHSKPSHHLPLVILEKINEIDTKRLTEGSK